MSKQINNKKHFMASILFWSLNLSKASSRKNHMQFFNIENPILACFKKNNYIHNSKLQRFVKHCKDVMNNTFGLWSYVIHLKVCC